MFELFTLIKDRASQLQVGDKMPTVTLGGVFREKSYMYTISGSFSTAGAEEGK